MTKRDHTTAPPIWQATIPAMTEAPTQTPPAETETLTARLERLLRYNNEHWTDWEIDTAKDVARMILSGQLIAQSAIRSALLAERVAGMREAAGIADGLLMQSKYSTKLLFELPVYAEDVSISIRAAADKLEAGE